MTRAARIIQAQVGEGEINCGGIYKYTSGLPQPPVTGLDELGSEEELYGTDEEAGEIEGEGEGAHGHRHLVHCHRLLGRQKIHSRFTLLRLSSHLRPVGDDLEQEDQGAEGQK